VIRSTLGWLAATVVVGTCTFFMGRYSSEADAQAQMAQVEADKARTAATEKNNRCAELNARITTLEAEYGHFNYEALNKMIGQAKADYDAACR
jgi:hypothetical protein